MIIYNKTWLSNLYLHQQAEQLCASGCITSDEIAAIKAKYPVGFYTPGIFARVGLFLLTFIIIFFSFGLLSLMFEAAHIIENAGWTLFLGAITAILLHVAVKQYHRYQSGVDDALQWIAFGFLTVSFTWLSFSADLNNHDPSNLTISLVVFFISLYFTLRFADVIMSAVTCSSFFAVVFFALKNTGSFGNATMPFLMMLAAAIIYVVAMRLVSKMETPFYAPIITVIQVISLLTLYCSRKLSGDR